MAKNEWRWETDAYIREVSGTKAIAIFIVWKQDSTNKWHWRIQLVAGRQFPTFGMSSGFNIAPSAIDAADKMAGWYQGMMGEEA